jgi:hypothetical protein
MAVQKILVIGGTGAQGVPIVERELQQPFRCSLYDVTMSTDLVAHGYDVVVLTRDPSSANAQKLSALGKVSFVKGATDDETALRKAFSGVDYAFVNLNSWALGIKGEIFWGIRIFEIAVQSGVKHYVWSSLDNFFLDTNYDDSLRVGHYYGKGNVEQWMRAIPQTPMRWSVICTSPYIQQLMAFVTPRKTGTGEWEFPLPLNDGAVPYTDLGDMGYYVRWLFENPERSAGMNLKVAVEHTSTAIIAAAFAEVIGQPCKPTNVPIEHWFDSGPMGKSRHHKIGSSTNLPNDPALLTVERNFTAWWKLYQRSGGNKGILRRDYALLDEIHPDRTRSVKQWMEKIGYTGERSQQITATRAWEL